MLAFEEFENGDGSGFDELARLVTVRGVPGISDVNEIFSRQLTTDLAKHRQAADTGIEHPDWTLCCHSLTATPASRPCCG